MAAAAAAAAATAASSSSNAGKQCVGISWGSDYGVVSIASAAGSSDAERASLVKEPTVLANADGNRATALWLNVANDEFLFGDGALAATLRFPQNAAHCIVKMLDRDSAVSAIQAAAAGKPAIRSKIPFTASSIDALKMVPIDAALVIPSEADEDEEDGENKKKSKPALIFDDFLKELDRMGTNKVAFDSDGALIRTTTTIGDSEAVSYLPKTTWECSMQLLRMFRTIVRDSLSGGSGSGGGFAALSSSSSSAIEEKPQVAVVAVPRQHVDRNIVGSLTRAAWRDWTGSSPSSSATIIHVVPKDIAALAAVMPVATFLPAATPSNVEAAETVLSVVVNWGATTLSISLFAHFTSTGAGGATTTATTLLSSRSLEAEVGGSYIDQCITKELLVAAQRKKLPPIEESSRSYRKFLAAAEKAKCVLSTAPTTNVEIESAVEGVDFVESGFTRSKLEMILVGMTGARLHHKFQTLLAAVMADVAGTKSGGGSNNNGAEELRKRRSILEAMCSSNNTAPVRFAVVPAGGTMRIPSLANFVRTTCATELQKLIAAASSTTTPTQPAQQTTRWPQLQPCKFDAREIVSIGACMLAQTASASTSSSAAAAVGGGASVGVFQVGPLSSGGGYRPAFTKEIIVVPRSGGLDDIDDDDDGAGAAASSPSKPAAAKCTTEEETITRTTKTDTNSKDGAPQAAVLSCSVFLSSAVIFPAGTLLPVSRNIKLTNSGDGDAKTITLTVRKEQLQSDNSSSKKKAYVLHFPVTLPEGIAANGFDVAVCAAGELTVVAGGGDELLRVEL